VTDAGAERSLQPGTRKAMRLMVVIWTTVITAGIVFYAIVGLTHG
jgi:hypothetical protein